MWRSADRVSDAVSFAPIADIGGTNTNVRFSCWVSWQRTVGHAAPKRSLIRLDANVSYWRNQVVQPCYWRRLLSGRGQAGLYGRHGGAKQPNLTSKKCPHLALSGHRRALPSRRRSTTRRPREGFSRDPDEPVRRQGFPVGEDVEAPLRVLIGRAKDASGPVSRRPPAARGWGRHRALVPLSASRTPGADFLRRHATGLRSPGTSIP